MEGEKRKIQNFDSDEEKNIWLIYKRIFNFESQIRYIWLIQMGERHGKYLEHRGEKKHREKVREVEQYY